MSIRLRGVMAVDYLIFNEGYGATGGDRLVRGELCSEAIRLGRLLVRLMPDEAEAGGLLALMLLHDARRAARVDDLGAYVALPHQDRSLWDEGRIREGERALEVRQGLIRSLELHEHLGEARSRVGVLGTTLDGVAVLIEQLAAVARRIGGFLPQRGIGQCRVVFLGGGNRGGGRRTPGGERVGD